MLEIHFSHVTVAVAGRVILDLPELRLAERRVALVGDNGAGKTSLMRLVNGLLAPTGGQVRVGGLDPARDGAQVRRRVGFLFQNPDAQIIMPTPREDVAFGLKAHGFDKAAQAARAMDALARFGLAARADDAAHTLSGGEKQKLALAGLLALEPELLLLDEPTVFLDRRARRDLLAELARLDQQLVIATHDLALAQTCDRAIWLDGGRVRADGAPHDVIAAYQGALDG